jgi:hypothetical protein
MYLSALTACRLRTSENANEKSVPGVEEVLRLPEMLGPYAATLKTRLIS